MQVQIVTPSGYDTLPWDREVLRQKLENLLQELKPGLTVSLSDLSDVYVSQTTHTVLAIDDDELVGYADLCEIKLPTGTEAYVGNLVVASVRRGQGIGTMLCEQILKIAEHNKISRVFLTSGAWRVEAQKLYQKHGFVKKDTVVLERSFSTGSQR